MCFIRTKTPTGLTYHDFELFEFLTGWNKTETTTCVLINYRVLIILQFNREKNAP